MSGYYNTCIINGMGHPRSDSMVANIQDTGVVLQVHWDSANPVKKE